MVFIKGLMRDKKGCGILTSNGTYFSDSWFIGVKNLTRQLLRE